MGNKNIVVIIIDALRPKNLSMFGYVKETDKNLKRIASESLLFREHFSTSNSTAPSLTSLFTAKYPNNHGIIHQLPYTAPEEFDKLRKTKFWLPSFLQKQGYNTMAIDWIGLWFKKGFNYYQEKETKPSKGRKFLNIPIVKKILLNLPSWAYKFGKKLTKVRSSEQFSPCDKTMDLAISKIKNSEKPFFLFVHFWDTHFPFSTTKFKGSGKKDINETLRNIKDKSQKEYFKKRITDIGLYSVDDMIDKYDAAIKNIDFQVGRLYDFLKKSGIWEDTIFVVLGDHGDSLTEHGIYFSHSGLFDVSIHVPLIMHLPGFEKKELNGFVQNTDIVPTIFDHLGFKTNEKIDGKSLMPLIKNNKKIRDKVFSFDGLEGDVKSVRTKDRKLIIAKNNVCNLCKSKHHENFEEYNLDSDPEEKKNIYSGESKLSKFLK